MDIVIFVDVGEVIGYLVSCVILFVLLCWVFNMSCNELIDVQDNVKRVGKGATLFFISGGIIMWLLGLAINPLAIHDPLFIRTPILWLGTTLIYLTITRILLPLELKRCLKNTSRNKTQL